MVGQQPSGRPLSLGNGPAGLTDTGLVEGRARARSLLTTALTRLEQENTAWLADAAAEALRLSQEVTRRARDCADAKCLEGDVLQAQGRLAAAQAAFGPRSWRSAGVWPEQDPSNAGWQRDLAVAYSRVGDVLQAQGRLEAAQAAFDQVPGDQPAAGRAGPEQCRLAAGAGGGVQPGRRCVAGSGSAGSGAGGASDQDLAISRRLAEQDPSNAGWQRELAVAHSRVGGVLQAQGRLEAAQAAFDQDLAISRRLAEQDPSNAGWQRDLAVAHSRVGGVLQAQGRLEAAQAAFDQDLAISRRLAEQDPSNAGWQQELAVAYSRVGGVLQAQGRLEGAGGLRPNLAISRRLAEQDLEQCRLAAGPGGGVQPGRRCIAGSGPAGSGAGGLRPRPGDQPASGRAGPEQCRLAAQFSSGLLSELAASRPQAEFRK